MIKLKKGDKVTLMNMRSFSENKNLRGSEALIESCRAGNVAFSVTGKKYKIRRDNFNFNIVNNEKSKTKR